MPYTTDIERLNYYEGEYLGATDFQAEQDYQRDMRRRHNVGQHTWGIVSGLDIAQVPTGVSAPGSGLPEVNVYVQPGMAVDGFGREIVVLSKTQLTTDLFAAYNNPGAQYTTMSVWISYAQVMLNPPSDACTTANASNSFGRIQETFALSVTQSGAPPTDDLIVVDGTSMQVPVPPTSTSTPPPGIIVLPYDDAIPYQEFSTDDSTDFWYVQIGQVFWDSNNQVLVQPPNLSTATGREYAGNVTAGIYVPGGALTIKDRFTPSPLPPQTTGVAVTIEGSLTVELLFNGQQNALIGGPPGANDPKALSPLTVIANATNDIIQLRNPSTTETWFINEAVDGTSLNLREITTQGKTVDGRIFVQSTASPATTPVPPSLQNVGIGTTTPRNPLAVRASGAWEELVSFEDTGGKTNWHLNQNPQGQGVKRGLNFCESKINANFRLFLQEGGGVGIGTGTPSASLDVGSGLIHVGGTTSPVVTAQGGYLGWNALTTNTGETDFINNQGLGTGGFAFMNAPQSGTPLTTLMFITGPGNVGIGTTAPQQMLSVNAGANVDQGNLNPGNVVSPGLTFGYGSGEGIASCRAIGGTNQYGLDFYTDFQRRMSINNGGAVTIGAASVNQQAVPQPGSLTVNGNRTYLLGTSPDNFHWIMGCGTTEQTVSGGNIIGNNAIGLSYDTATQQGWVILPANWNLYVGGSIGAGGGKGGYVMDRFINRKSHKLERGDVVVVHHGSVDHYYGQDNRIPILEVEIANKAEDTRVCGIVDEPVASANALRDLHGSQVDTSLVGQMVTLGAYAHCKADATNGAIAAGDLLTTSSTPGHVQKVSEGAVPAGAIIGKALGPLKKGKGIIPILVSHQ
jgi:hypothetical protein